MRTLSKEAGFCYHNLLIRSCLIVLFTLSYLALAGYSPALAIVIDGVGTSVFVSADVTKFAFSGGCFSLSIFECTDTLVRYNSSSGGPLIGSALTLSDNLRSSVASGAGVVVGGEQAGSAVSTFAMASPNGIDAFIEGGFTFRPAFPNFDTWQMNAFSQAVSFDNISIVGPPGLSFTETVHLSLSNVIPTTGGFHCGIDINCGTILDAFWIFTRGGHPEDLLLSSGVNCGDGAEGGPCASSYDQSFRLPMTVGEVVDLEQQLRVELDLTACSNCGNPVHATIGTRGTQFLLFDPPPSGVSFVAASGETYTPASNTQPNAVPEPSTWLLLSSGIASLAAWKWWRDRA